MILATHLIVGAAIIANLGLPFGVILALLSHYFLDALPHWDYSIENISNKRWKKSLPDFLKIFIDIFLAYLVIFIFSKNIFLVLTATIAALPDIIEFSTFHFPNKIFLFLDNKIHDPVHFPKSINNKSKIPAFWGIFINLLLIAAAICLL